MKHDAAGLKLQEEVLDLVGGREGYRRRQETLALAQRAVDHGRIDATQIEPRAVALHPRIKRRSAIHESDREAELLGEEVARRLDVGDEQLRLGGNERGPRGPLGLAGHGLDSLLARLAPRP